MELFEEIQERFVLGKLGCEDAAVLLGCSVRQFLRLRDRYEERGLAGLADGRVGKPSPHRAGDAEVARVTRLYAEHYRGFSVAHFHEFLKEKHRVKRSYGWTKTVLSQSGLVKPVRRGGPHRLRRPRKACEGMMMHQDASKHIWFGEDYCDLVVTLDDATSEITSAFFCAEEGTLSSFRGLQETIERKGLFCSLYTDHGGHYWHAKAEEKGVPTQVGRALRQLGIKHILAGSPQARGRSERMFGTLQERLPKELALQGILTMGEANRYLHEVYLPRHNKRFTVPPADNRSAFVPYAGRLLKDIFCIQETRIVASDNTIRYNHKKLQIPHDHHRHHYVKCEVTVHHYPDDTMALFHGPRLLAEYQKNGEIKQKESSMKAA